MIRPSQPASEPRLKVLVLGLIIDGTDVGGTYSSFKWIEALGHKADVTLLCMQRPGRISTAQQLPHVRVVTWPEPAFLGRFERIRGQLKPQWPLFVWLARRWINKALARGERFDVAHQIQPQAMRHRTPLRFFSVPYVMGPLDGTLPTPKAMAGEVKDTLFVRLRALDALRLRLDGGLRASYERAALLLGVAPYIADLLKGLRIQRFETRLERAGEPTVMADRLRRAPPVGELKLLHVGRTVRTKGLRDLIRAMAQLRDLPGITLTSAGDGPDLAACKAEAAALGVADRIDFLGRVPREKVEDLYASHDVFAFPTFREPMGGVFFEAMRWGLPVVTADYGGPQAIVDESSGVRIPLSNPSQFARDISEVLRGLAHDPARLASLARGALRRMERIGTWEDKADDTIELYRQVMRR